MSIAIRRIGPDDGQALMEFYNALSEPSKRTFRPLGISTSREECEKIIGDNLPAEAGSDAGIEKKFDLVAVDAARIVGWSFLWSLETGRPTFGLSVADEYQAQGLGTLLMDTILEEAVARGVPKITLTVVQDNEKALLMYERRGFVRQEGFVGEDGLRYYYMTLEFGGSPRFEPESGGKTSE